MLGEKHVTLHCPPANDSSQVNFDHKSIECDLDKMPDLVLKGSLLKEICTYMPGRWLTVWLEDGRKSGFHWLSVVNSKQKQTQRPIKTDANSSMSQWGLKVKTSNRCQARESAHQARWRLVEYKWREFDRTNHDVLKKNQSNQSKFPFSLSFSLSLCPGYSFNNLMRSQCLLPYTVDRPSPFIN